jgi:hypothetical protein
MLALWDYVTITIMVVVLLIRLHKLKKSEFVTCVTSVQVSTWETVCYTPHSHRLPDECVVV